MAAIRGSDADAFFGASPVVASALGIRSGATPGGRIHPNICLPTLLCKADISTWQTTGHFYLALTVGPRQANLVAIVVPTPFVSRLL